MTVAAVVVAGDAASAVGDAAGRAGIRRIVDSAWAGGAVPIVVVAPDPDGTVAAALTGSPAVLAEPAPASAGPVGQVLRGMAVAAERVTDTDAVLVWPARLVWTDPETVTSLIEASGVRGPAVLRPMYQGSPGWPVLVPVAFIDALHGLAAERTPDELLADLEASGIPLVSLELGDPGVTHDRTTSIDQLPEYDGPPGPAGGPPPEWGAPAGERADDIALEGPALAPYTQAAAETE